MGALPPNPRRLPSSSLLLYNRLPVIQISMCSSFNQVLVAASRRRRPAKPPGALCITPSHTMHQLSQLSTGTHGRLLCAQKPDRPRPPTPADGMGYLFFRDSTK